MQQRAICQRLVRTISLQGQRAVRLPQPLLLLQQHKQRLQQALPRRRQTRRLKLLPPQHLLPLLPLNPQTVAPVAATIIQHALPATGAMHHQIIVLIPAVERRG